MGMGWVQGHSAPDTPLSSGTSLGGRRRSRESSNRMWVESFSFWILPLSPSWIPDFFFRSSPHLSPSPYTRPAWSLCLPSLLMPPIPACHHGLFPPHPPPHTHQHLSPLLSLGKNPLSLKNIKKIPAGWDQWLICCHTMVKKFYPRANNRAEFHRRANKRPRLSLVLRFGTGI